MSSYWPCFEFDRIDAKNATIVFSAGLYEINLRQPGQQRQPNPKTVASAHLPWRPEVTMLRKPIWIEKPHFQGYGCSECAWVFKPSGPPGGNSLDEMKKSYERQRDKEFATHVCAEHLEPRRQKAK